MIYHVCCYTNYVLKMSPTTYRLKKTQNSLGFGSNKPLLFSCDVPLATAVISVNRNRVGPTDDSVYISCHHCTSLEDGAGMGSNPLTCDLGTYHSSYELVVYRAVVKKFSGS